jgi:hypothetical protein
LNAFGRNYDFSQCTISVEKPVFIHGIHIEIGRTGVVESLLVCVALTIFCKTRLMAKACVAWIRHCTAPLKQATLMSDVTWTGGVEHWTPKGDVKLFL